MYDIKKYAHSLALVLLLGGGLVFTATPAQAQVDITPGVRAGFVSASFGGDTDQFGQAFLGIQRIDNVETGRRAGFSIGGFAIVDFGGPFALQPELRYIQRGYGMDVSVTGFGGQQTTLEGTLKVDYLDVPVLARFEFPTSGFTPHVLAGPRIGFNINAEQKTEGGGQSSTEDISEGVSGTEFGLELGAGADFRIGAGTVIVDVRYGLGLTDVPDGGDLSLSNRAFMVTAGVAF